MSPSTRTTQSCQYCDTFSTQLDVCADEQVPTYLTDDDFSDSVLLRYKNSYELNFPPSIFYTPTTSVDSWKNTQRVKYSALTSKSNLAALTPFSVLIDYTATLPANVHLLSLKLVNGTSNKYILR